MGPSKYRRATGERPAHWEINSPTRADVEAMTHDGSNRFVIAGERKQGDGCVDSPSWDRVLQKHVASYNVGGRTLRTALSRYPTWIVQRDEKKKIIGQEHAPDSDEMLAIRVLAEATRDQDGENPCWKRIDVIWWDEQ